MSNAPEPTSFIERLSQAYPGGLLDPCQRNLQRASMIIEHHAGIIKATYANPEGLWDDLEEQETYATYMALAESLRSYADEGIEAPCTD